MPFWIQFLANFIGLICFYCPRFVRHGIALALSSLVWDVIRFRRFTVLKNMTIAFPHLSREAKYEMAKKSLYHLVIGLFEFFSLPWVTEEWHKKNVFFHGMENYQQAHQQGKGILFLSLHLGNGDFGCAMFPYHHIFIHLISKKFKINWVNQLWFGVREKMCTRFIDPHGSKTPFEILSALKQKHGVVFVMDQFMGRPYGIESHFFGRKTGTAYGLALFAIKTGAPVVPVFTYRDQDMKTHVVFDPEIKFTSKQQNRDLQTLEMTEKYNHWIESAISRHPEQWMWIHRRWKRWE
jgi:KDO2-lipid IV(A) lauroyltransferase